MTIHELAANMRAQAQRCRERSIAKVAISVVDIEALLDAIPGCKEDLLGLQLFGRLSIRERQVVRLVASGSGTNRDFARELSTTTQTVKNHLTRIYTKTGMGSRFELFSFIQEHPGLLGPQAGE